MLGFSVNSVPEVAVTSSFFWEIVEDSSMETGTDSTGTRVWLDGNTASDNKFQYKYIKERKLVDD